MQKSMKQFHRDLETLVRRGTILAVLDNVGDVILWPVQCATDERLANALTPQEFRQLRLAGRLDGNGIAGQF